MRPLAAFYSARMRGLTYFCARRAHFLPPKRGASQPPILFSREKRTGRWSGPRENAPGGLRLSAPPEDEDGPLDPHLAGRVRFTKDCVGCRGALLLQVGLRASWPRRFLSGTARRHRLGRRSRHGPSGPRRKCGVRRREPAPRATRVYEIKRGPRSAVRCGEQKRWWDRKHPSWRGLEMRPPAAKLSSAAHGAESSAACGAGLSLSRFRRQLPRKRAPGRGASLTPAARRSAASGKSARPAGPRRIPPGWSGAANRRFPGGR